MIPVHGYAATSPSSGLSPLEFERRDPGPDDILIDILYCVICHSDIHTVRDELGGTHYPMVPGHEIIGRVASVGKKVKSFRPGQLAGVGCFVNSCRRCPYCRASEEQFCANVV